MQIFLVGFAIKKTEITACFVVMLDILARLTLYVSLFLQKFLKTYWDPTDWDDCTTILMKKIVA